MSAFFFFTSESVDAVFTPWGDPGITRLLDPVDWGGAPAVYLEVHGQADAISYPLKARLYNITLAALVSGSEISSAPTTKTRARSGSFSLDSGANEYRVEFGGLAGFGPFTLYDAVLIVVPV